MKRSRWSIPYVVFMAIFVVLPLLLILVYAFQDGNGHFTLSNITHFFSDSDALGTFAVSIEVAIENTLICILLGYPAAWILANKDLNRSAVTIILFIMPMWINALMRTLATAELFNTLGITFAPSSTRRMSPSSISSSIIDSPRAGQSTSGLLPNADLGR